ncbi:hypothetical protein OG196_04365 [Kitasatospora purpeofusca]|uniref:hypothetical protein n=1 Tax=Kitasatospora purpeofusca TaxID=67352 RepID=UPI002E1055B0|nr:hypothetical protein OG715_03765 [Kitasatospora purpeofusca]WSR38378.1 hypothetical protein OG196_04365 [Kitasatospora purpeofusca]
MVRVGAGFGGRGGLDDHQVGDQRAVRDDDVDGLQRLERCFGVVDGQAQEHGEVEAGALMANTGAGAQQKGTPEELDPVVGVLGQGQDAVHGPRPDVVFDGGDAHVLHCPGLPSGQRPVCSG